MARLNKVYQGPYTENTPQVQEAPAAVAILPGSVITRTAGKYALATATTTGKVFIAQENYLAMEGVDTAYAVDDVVLGMELLDEQFFAARIATGNNLVKDSPLTPGAGGVLVLAGVSDMVVATSEETYNNNTGSVQLVRVRGAKGYLTAAA
jgi:hypothetical protein